MCKSIIKRKGKETIKKRYFITGLKDVHTFAKAVRSHWAIENNVHRCLDVIFHDDQCPVMERNTAENLAIIRRIVYNRIKMLSHMDTLSMGKRACIYDDSFRAKILFSRLEAPGIICSWELKRDGIPVLGSKESKLIFIQITELVNNHRFKVQNAGVNMSICVL